MRLLKKISIALALMLATTAALWFAPGSYPHDLAAIINKRDILQSRPSPRIIIVGGSNLTTIRSPNIEKALNSSFKTSFSVVNMGLWAGLRMDNYLDELKPYLLKGDIIVICQEYATMLSLRHHEYMKTENESEKFFFLLSPERHVTEALKNGSILYIIRNILQLNQLKLKSYVASIVRGHYKYLFTKGFQKFKIDYNDHGDRVRPFPVKRPLSDAGTLSMPEQDELQYLENFYNYGKSHGIEVFFLFPPFPLEEYLKNKNAIETLYVILNNRLKIQLLNRPSDNIYPEDYFADTVNHLQPVGENARTGRLIRHLERHLY